MTHHLLRRLFLAASFILLAAMFLLVLTLNALKAPMAATTALPEGPYLVKDIMTGTANTYPAPIIPMGDKVYFFAYDDQGHNLWLSDGTEEGTQQVKDLNELTGAVTNPPKPPAQPTPLPGFNYPAVVDEKLFFTANDGVHGRELWVSNGSLTETFMVRDINAEISNSGPMLLTELNGQLIFSPKDGTFGLGLWKSDGTFTNTVLVKEFSGPRFTGMVELNGKVYFAGEDETHGAELWTSDGTDEGTFMVHDINMGPDSSTPHVFYATDTHIFFFAYYPDYPHFWQSDGTLTGTKPVQDTFTGTTFAVDYNQLSRGLTDEAIFFIASDDTHDKVLWKSDGTITGTYMVKDIFPHTYAMMQPIGNRMFLFASDGEHGTELWVSDGTEKGTYLVKDINPGKSDSICFDYYNNNEQMDRLNEHLFFVANDGEHGCELWISDGSEEGTFMVRDINSGELSSSPEYLGATDHTLFFMADDGEHGYELWSLGNMAPMAKDDTAVTRMNHPISIPVTNNDSDVNLDTLTISAVDDPAFGTATIDGESIIYTPDNGFIGSDTFSYTVQESGGGLTAVAQITITVTGHHTYLPITLHQAGDR